VSGGGDVQAIAAPRGQHFASSSRRRAPAFCIVYLKLRDKQGVLEVRKDELVHEREGQGSQEIEDDGQRAHVAGASGPGLFFGMLFLARRKGPPLSVCSCATAQAERPSSEGQRRRCQRLHTATNTLLRQGVQDSKLAR